MNDGAISKQDVLHAAKLARLAVGDKEAEKFREDLSAVLSFVRTLEEPSVGAVQPTSHIGGLQNVMRDDIREAADTGKETERAEAMMSQFPSLDGRYLKVPAILSHKSRGRS